MKIPCSCAASSASAICFAMGNASSSGMGAFRDPIRKRRAFDEFQDERVRAAGIFEAVDGGDVRMVERREHLRFAWNRAKRSPSRVKPRQNLQRDVAIQLRIPRPIDLSHAACADGRE